ncbi:hypothetical protein J6Z19_07105 [bacterium]|nr:hypothetical protein [bacterium]
MLSVFSRSLSRTIFCIDISADCFSFPSRA